MILSGKRLGHFKTTSISEKWAIVPYQFIICRYEQAISALEKAKYVII